MAEMTRQEINKAIKDGKKTVQFGTPILDPKQANKLFFENEKRKKQHRDDEQKGGTLV